MTTIIQASFILNSIYATDSAQALDIYNRIHPELLAGNTVALDFEGVHVFSVLFFNVAIAQLLRDIPPATLNDCLKIEGLPGHGREQLLRSIENAKGFYLGTQVSCRTMSPCPKGR